MPIFIPIWTMCPSGVQTERRLSDLSYRKGGFSTVAKSYTALCKTVNIRAPGVVIG
jgi:hypothetical protein